MTSSPATIKKLTAIHSRLFSQLLEMDKKTVMIDQQRHIFNKMIRQILIVIKMISQSSLELKRMLDVHSKVIKRSGNSKEKRTFLDQLQELQEILNDLLKVQSNNLLCLERFMQQHHIDLDSSEDSSLISTTKEQIEGYGAKRSALLKNRVKRAVRRGLQTIRGR